MITWPIFVALILAVTAVYFQVKREDEQAAKEQAAQEEAEEKEQELKNEKEDDTEEL